MHALRAYVLFQTKYVPVSLSGEIVNTDLTAMAAIVDTAKAATNTVEVLVSGHPRNEIKISVTGASRLLEWFS